MSPISSRVSVRQGINNEIPLHSESNESRICTRPDRIIPVEQKKLKYSLEPHEELMNSGTRHLIVEIYYDTFDEFVSTSSFPYDGVQF